AVNCARLLTRRKPRYLAGSILLSRAWRSEHRGRGAAAAGDGHQRHADAGGTAWTRPAPRLELRRDPARGIPQRRTASQVVSGQGPHPELRGSLPPHGVAFRLVGKRAAWVGACLLAVRWLLSGRARDRGLGDVSDSLRRIQQPSTSPAHLPRGV